MSVRDSVRDIDRAIERMVLNNKAGGGLESLNTSSIKPQLIHDHVITTQKVN